MTTNRESMLAKLADLDAEHAKAVAGGGEKYVDRHRARGKLLARERIELLVDEGSAFLELSPLAGWGSDFTVGASVVTGIGVVEGVECLITANDPTVKGGASNPWTVKKGFRAAQIAEDLFRAATFSFIFLIELVRAAFRAGAARASSAWRLFFSAARAWSSAPIA